jgi:hypothetical protein
VGSEERGEEKTEGLNPGEEKSRKGRRRCRCDADVTLCYVMFMWMICGFGSRRRARGAFLGGQRAHAMRFFCRFSFFLLGGEI